MKNVKNKNKKIVYLVGILIVMILLFINLTSNHKEVPQDDAELTEEEVEQIEKDNIADALKDMEERDRMEYYCGMFLGYIEEEEYEKAYNLLYPEFKENYFPTLESFTEYVQNNFSEMSNIEHDNIERNGDVYVLWIYISDALNGKPGEKKKMNIVIKENDYNDFVLSFSVI